VRTFEGQSIRRKNPFVFANHSKTSVFNTMQDISLQAKTAPREPIAKPFVIPESEA
jgi:hypothetical protein